MSNKKLHIGSLLAEDMKIPVNGTLTGNRIMWSKSPQDVLAEWWDIKSNKEAEDAIDYLIDLGARQYYAEAFKLLNAYLKHKGETLASKDNDYEEELKLVSNFYEAFPDRTLHGDDAKNVISLVVNINNKDLITSWSKFEMLPKLTEEDFALGIAAYDYAKLVVLARMSLSAGYIDETSFWKVIETAYTIAHNEFNSWDTFAKSCHLGYWAWNGTEGPGNYLAISDAYARLFHNTYEEDIRSFAW